MTNTTITDEKLREAVRELSMAAGIADTFHARNCCAAMDTIEAALIELERLRAAQQWQPIESAPIDGCLWSMLGHPKYTVSEIGYFDKRHNVWCSGDGRVLFAPNGPTHWRPLPLAPAGTEGEAK